MITPETQKNVFDELRQKLSDGIITSKEFLDNFFVEDQSTTNISVIEKDLEFLCSPYIENYFNSKPEYVDEYKRILSITEFHFAQRLAIENLDGFLIHFQKALDSANDSHWAAYIQGTIAYLEGKEISEQIIKNAEIPHHTDQRNSDILRNFNVCLKQRGKPSYREDYFKMGK